MTASNILIDELPKSVWVDGEEFEIAADFRTSILFEMLMQDDDVEDAEKTVKALRLYFPVIPQNLEAAVEALLWFYGCGKEKGSKKEEAKGKKRHERIYSFDYDDDYIFAAFLSQYGIDLQDIEYLHWWKFRALFNSLTDDNQIVKIMQYRSMDISSDLPKEQAKFYKRMKRLYALPKSQSETEKNKAIENALMNGGDLTGLLDQTEEP